MSFAPALPLREGDREKLANLARLPSVPSGLAKRARMVLLAADGMPNAEIARAAGVSRPTVISWRQRYQRGGIRALEDEPRSGRPPEISEADVVAATLADGGKPPARLGITRWSARFLAAELGISFASVARIWRKWNIQPHRIETFNFSTDPEPAVPQEGGRRPPRRRTACRGRQLRYAQAPAGECLAERQPADNLTFITLMGFRQSQGADLRVRASTPA